MKTKTLVISILIGAAIIAGALIFSGSGANSDNSRAAPNNVSISDGKQIIEISAKGGYSPRRISAKADTPSIIRVKTQGTFDCSLALSVPAIGYRTNLPTVGITDIQIPAQKPGSSIRGVCAMGMYSFTVDFN